MPHIKSSALSSMAVHPSSGNHPFDVSVVLNVHRESFYLRPTLLSLLDCATFSAACGLRVQLIAVFDRPDQETLDVFQTSDLSAFTSVRTLQIDVGSLGLARNAGIAAAEGEFVWTADGDDLVSVNAIRQHVAVARAQPDGDFAVFCEYCIGFGEEYFIGRYEPSSLLCAADFAFSHPYVSRIFLKRSVFDSLQYSDLRLSKGFAYEDWDLNARLFARGFRFEIAPDCALFYRQRENSLLRLTESNSARLPPHCELFEPAVFSSAMRDRRAKYEEWQLLVAARPTLHKLKLAKRAFGTFAIREAVADAARIEPEINPPRLETASGYCPVPSDARHWGFDLEATFELVGLSKFTDILLLPWLQPGGAEKYILEVIDLISRQGTRGRVLIICGQASESVGWSERLRGEFVFLDIFNGFPLLDKEARDQLTVRLILSVAQQGARLHVKPSEFSHRILDRFGSALSTCLEVIYYRFTDLYFTWNGARLRHTDNIRFFRRNSHFLHTLITDCETTMQQDLDILPQMRGKFHRIYAHCTTPLGSDGAPAPRFRLLWASRVAAEKRPELLASIAHALRRQSPEIGIDIYGKAERTHAVGAMFGQVNLAYQGSFDSFESLPLDRYDALIYTSAFDGLPNIILEAMASGLVVVAADVGGVSEAVTEDTGFLVPNLADEDCLADAYAEAVRRLYADWLATQRKRQAARDLITMRHGMATFAEAVGNAIPSAGLFGMKSVAGVGTAPKPLPAEADVS